MAKRTGNSKQRKHLVKAVPFLPDNLDTVKAIAMTGMSDDEMAVALGISPNLMQSWKAFYPSFAKAIELGRTAADAKVVAALFENAVGFVFEEDAITKDGDILTVKKQRLPETAAQKFWLENRKPEWRHARQSQVAIGGHPNLPPIGVKQETKLDVINSILNQISPKPDGK